MGYEVSVFVENKPGRIQYLTQVLEEAGVRLVAFRVSSLGEFGVIKLVVSDPDKAYEALRAANLTVQKRSVVALACSKALGLVPLAKAVGEAGLNVEEALGVSLSGHPESLMIFEVNEETALTSLTLPEGVRQLSAEELYGL